MRTILTAIAFTFYGSVIAADSIIPGYSTNPGVELFEEFQYQEAVRYFQSNLQGDEPLSELSNAYLAKYAILRKDGEAAVEHIERSLAVEPNETAELTLAAEAYCTKAMQVSMFSALKLGKKCGKQYNAAADRSPNDSQALQNAIYFHLEAPGIAGGSKSLAKEYLSKLESVSEEDARVIKVLFSEREYGKDDAIKLADQYFAKRSEKSKSLYDLAIFYRDRNLPQKAIALFERIVNKEEDALRDWHRQDAQFQLAELYILETNNTSQGISLIEGYVNSSRDIYDVHYFWSRLRLARTYKEIGDAEKFEAMILAIKEADYSHDENFAKSFDAEFK